MSITTKFVNQPGTEEFGVANTNKVVSTIFNNPKLVAAHMMQSMLEGHIEMCADYTLSTDEIEANLAAEHLRLATADMFADYIEELRDAVHAAILDPEFCKTNIKSITMNRNTDGSYAMDDAVVDLTFDFKHKRNQNW